MNNIPNLSHHSQIRPNTKSTSRERREPMLISHWRKSVRPSSVPLRRLATVRIVEMIVRKHRHHAIIAATAMHLPRQPVEAIHETGIVATAEMDATITASEIETMTAVIEGMPTIGMIGMHHVQIITVIADEPIDAASHRPAIMVALDIPADHDATAATAILQIYRVMTRQGIDHRTKSPRKSIRASRDAIIHRVKNARNAITRKRQREANVNVHVPEDDDNLNVFLFCRGRRIFFVEHLLLDILALFCMYIYEFVWTFIKLPIQILFCSFDWNKVFM